MSGTDLDRPITVVSPRTGEVLTLDASTEDLGGYLADIREHESLLREGKNLVGGELVRRMDEGACWTLHTGGLKLSAPSPAPAIEYDELALRESLLQLADEGVISVEAVDRAVEPVVTYRARKSGINALQKLGGRVAAVIDAHANEVSKTRYVKVERA